MDLRLPGRSGGVLQGTLVLKEMEALLWGEGCLGEVEGVVAADTQLEDGFPLVTTSLIMSTITSLSKS